MTTLGDCVVATDSEEVRDVCLRLGAKVVLTAASHASGTDRVAEVAAMRAYRDYDVIVNVQGDEPFMEGDQVRSAVLQVQGGWEIGTVATPVRTLEAWRDPAVVKVTRRPDGAALYFSRAPIPFVRDRLPTPEELSTPHYLRHVGVYAYGRSALERWAALPPAGLEMIEQLEQLRPLSAGLTIGVGLVDHAEGGIDTPDDARRAEARLTMMTSHTGAEV
jgi:3-deoxy-manno-octulosonate cytidylyltransferase (CMP-KDO synthetase)